MLILARTFAISRNFAQGLDSIGDAVQRPKGQAPPMDWDLTSPQSIVGDFETTKQGEDLVLRNSIFERDGLASSGIYHGALAWQRG